MEAFDPLRDLPRAQSDKPAEWTAVNLRALSPFQRALLVIDGTVTRFIEAYTLEPVEVVQLSHEESELVADSPWLEATRGTRAVIREVLIEARYSRTLYVSAVSTLIPERLPPEMRQRLDQPGEAIGRLLNEGQLETRREVLWLGREHHAELPEALRERSDGEFVSRAYRILSGGRPLALIHERFPTSFEQHPSMH
jgi:chorismate-pyruvate lyase